MRVGQKNKLTYRWARKGSRPRAAHDQRTQSTYLFGAVCPERGAGAALVLPACNCEAMQLHLDEIATKVALGAHAIISLIRPAGMAPKPWWFRTTSHSCRCRRAHPNSTARKTSGSSCARIGCQTGFSDPSTISSTTAAMLGTHSSTNPGRLCPSRDATGQQSVTQSEDWYKVSVTHRRARRNGDANLAIVAERSWMKREHRIAIYIGRNCRFCRRLSFYQLVAILEDHLYDFVHEIVRQILVCDRKVVETDRMIILGPRTIGAGRNQGWRDFLYLVSHGGTLLGRRLYEIDGLFGIEFRKGGYGKPGGNDYSVEFAVGHLRRHLFDRSKANVGGDSKDFENLRDIDTPCTRPRTDADSQSGEIVERLDRKALQCGEVKRAVVHREY